MRPACRSSRRRRPTRPGRQGLDDLPPVVGNDDTQGPAAAQLHQGPLKAPRRSSSSTTSPRTARAWPTSSRPSLGAGGRHRHHPTEADRLLGHRHQDVSDQRRRRLLRRLLRRGGLLSSSCATPASTARSSAATASTTATSQAAGDAAAEGTIVTCPCAPADKPAAPTSPPTTRRIRRRPGHLRRRGLRRGRHLPRGHRRRCPATARRMNTYVSDDDDDGRHQERSSSTTRARSSPSSSGRQGQGRRIVSVGQIE